MMFLTKKMLFSWLYLASTLDVVFSASGKFKLSKGLGEAICVQNEQFTQKSEIQPALKTSSMQPNLGSGSSSDCGWSVLKGSKGASVKSCSSISAKRNSGISPRVLNGQPTQPGEFPSLVTLYQYSETFVNETYTEPATWYFRCSGILISPQWILTEKKCFNVPREENNLSISRIYAGNYNHTPGTEPDVEQGPSQPVEFFDHPQIAPGDYRWEFTMTKFSPPFTLTERVQLARWPKEVDVLPKDVPVTIVGWGAINASCDDPYAQWNGKIQFIPHKKEMNVMDQQKCIDVYNKETVHPVGEEQFCLEDDEPCPSGPAGRNDVAGFSVDADGQQTLIGVKSTWWTDVGVPPLMTATSFLRKWAEDLIAE